MQHTIAAVFDKQSQAQHALDDLVASGFSPNDIRLSQSETTDQTGPASTSSSRDDESFGSGIRSFFAEIFGPSSRNDAELYSEAVLHGNYVVTVNVPEDNLVDRATDVLDRYDPVDIDEQASAWKSGGWAAAESMRQDAATAQYSTQQQDTGQQSTANRQPMEDQQSARQTGQQAENGSQAIPVIQEELKIGKREVQRGGVRVYQRVVEKPVQQNVNLREERVTVERHAVDQPATEADLSALKEGSFEVRETAEEPVIEKVARVVEEVVIGKEVQQRQEQVSDTVRSTQVEVEQLAPGTSTTTAQPASLDDDSYYRNHWNSNYASAGGSYDDYAPAYRYGSTLASSEQYRGRRWEDVEPAVRSDWEARNPGSPWEKMKAAVRHGWDRMTK